MFDSTITIGDTVILTGGVICPKMKVVFVGVNSDQSGNVLPLSEANPVSVTWFVNGLQYAGSLPLGCVVRAPAVATVTATA